MVNRNVIWFGTRRRMQWVPTPSIDADFSEKGFSSRVDYLNGGAFTRKSKATHKEYNISYADVKTRDDIRAITDYSSGLYGDDPIYFLEPMAMDKNVLPQYFASPFLGAYDAPILLGDVAPNLQPTPNNDLAYPVDSAQYNYASSTETKKVWVPIPPGHTAWVGAHGVADGFGGVRVTPYVSSILPATATAIALRPVDDNIRVDTPFDGDTYDGIELDLSLLGDAPVIDYSGSYLYPATDLYPSEDLLPLGPKWEPPFNRATYAIIAGIMVQVLKTGVIPKNGGFISGQGHGGCSFEAHPQVTSRSAVLHRGQGMAGAQFRLVETEGWK